MVIIRMKGGLGNQMFQYALYCELEYLGRQVKMDDVTGFRNDRQRDPALSVFGTDYQRATQRKSRTLPMRIWISAAESAGSFWDDIRWSMRSGTVILIRKYWK